MNVAIKTLVVLATMVGTSSAQDIDHIEISSTGPAGSRQSRLMGVYRPFPTETSTPVYKKDGAKLYIFRVNGRWRVGPDVSTFSGTSLKHPERGLDSPPRTGWQYWDDEWKDDEDIVFEEIVDQSCTSASDCSENGKACDGIQDVGCICKNNKCKISSGCGTYGAFFFRSCDTCDVDDCEDENTDEREACRVVRGRSGESNCEAPSPPLDNSCTSASECYDEGKECYLIADASCICKNNLCKISSNCGGEVLEGGFTIECSTCGQDDCEDEGLCTWNFGTCCPKQASCPVNEPVPGEGCPICNQTCKYGQECCCGECDASMVYFCDGGFGATWSGLHTDFCLNPHCENVCYTENGGPPCQFPFSYKGKTYTECTYDETINNKPWCAYVENVRINRQGNARSGQLGDCDLESFDSHCPVEQIRCSGKDTGCCTPENPCNEGDGDCDTDADCGSDLVCGSNNCKKDSRNQLPNESQGTWDRTDDCCERPSPPGSCSIPGCLSAGRVSGGDCECFDVCACTYEWAPVCDINNETHSNAGCAQCSGAQVQCNNECPCPPGSCFIDGCTNSGLGAGGVCYCYDDGETVCENHGYGEDKCLALDCCHWDDGQCWSSVGQEPCQVDQSCTTWSDCYENGKACDGIADAGCICKNNKCKISSGCGTHGAFFFRSCDTCDVDDCEDENYEGNVACRVVRGRSGQQDNCQGPCKEDWEQYDLDEGDDFCCDSDFAPARCCHPPFLHEAIFCS